jgi:misacylated tRNA(Ala) deacylase
MPTERLYLDDGDVFTADGRVLAVRADALACDRTCFYPGGGGQPPDHGVIDVEGVGSIPIVSVRAEDDGTVWHVAGAPIVPHAVGRAARLSIDRARRLVLARYHTVLHVLNTTALRTCGGWITGVQIGVDYSRIDFKLEGMSPAICAALEAKVNAVLAGDHALRSYSIPEAEFRARGDLLRTLEAQPPVVGGRVRVVEIEGFDAQACGGTHVRSTAENKGRINKRLYVRLATP